MTKFKVGDRVRLLAGVDTGVNGSPEHLHWLQGFTYPWRGSYSVHDQWLELVTTNGEEQRMGRRTFKLIKDMPGYKKGTLFQEQCEDGTQPYSAYMNFQGKKIDHHVNRLEYADRSEVENNPSWFVEVFKVEPQYMTQLELHQWEGFKAASKRQRASKVAEPVILPGERRRGRPVGSTNSWTPAQKRAQSRRMKKYWAAKKAA